MREVNGVYLADTARVTGDVVLSPGVNLWFGVVIRGDLARITLGEGVNVQDNSVLHTDFGVDLTLEPGVVVGHGAIVHGTRVGAGTLIGMGAVVLSGTDIGEGCVIAAGAVLAEGATVPPRSLVMGVPGRVVKQVSDEQIERVRRIRARYAEMARAYAAGEVGRPYG